MNAHSVVWLNTNMHAPSHKTIIIPTIDIVPCSVYQNSGTDMFFNIFVEPNNKLKYYLTKYIYSYYEVSHGGVLVCVR